MSSPCPQGHGTWGALLVPSKPLLSPPAPACFTVNSIKRLQIDSDRCMISLVKYRIRELFHVFNEDILFDSQTYFSICSWKWKYICSALCYCTKLHALYSRSFNWISLVELECWCSQETCCKQENPRVEVEQRCLNVTMISLKRWSHTLHPNIN
jgi:hypothetical protein